MTTAVYTPPLALGLPGAPELILIFAIVLLLFGAKKLPEFARGLGKSISEFRKAQKEIEDEINKPIDDKADPKKDVPSTPEAVTPPPPNPPQHAPKPEEAPRETAQKRDA